MTTADCMAFTGHKDIKSFNAYLKVDLDEILTTMLVNEQEAHSGKSREVDQPEKRKQIASLKQ